MGESGWCRVPLMVFRREVRRIDDRTHAIGDNRHQTPPILSPRHRHSCHRARGTDLKVQRRAQRVLDAYAPPIGECPGALWRPEVVQIDCALAHVVLRKMGWCRVPLLSDRREVRRSNDRMHAIGVAGTRSH